MTTRSVEVHHLQTFPKSILDFCFYYLEWEYHIDLRRLANNFCHQNNPIHEAFSGSANVRSRQEFVNREQDIWRQNRKLILEKNKHRVCDSDNEEIALNKSNRMPSSCTATCFYNMDYLQTPPSEPPNHAHQLSNYYNEKFIISDDLNKKNFQLFSAGAGVTGPFKSCTGGVE